MTQFAEVDRALSVVFRRGDGTVEEARTLQDAVEWFCHASEVDQTQITVLELTEPVMVKRGNRSISTTYLTKSEVLTLGEILGAV